jgi:type II secretory pathway component GspD/PulD (secretin)
MKKNKNEKNNHNNRHNTRNTKNTPNSTRQNTRNNKNTTKKNRTTRRRTNNHQKTKQPKQGILMWKKRPKANMIIIQAINPTTKRFKGFITGLTIKEIKKKAKKFRVITQGKYWHVPDTHIGKVN